MNVLFQSRSTLFTVPGGDTTQMIKTSEALKQLGVEVKISTEQTVTLAGYDIVHLFNLMRPQDVLLQARNARKQGKKVALSTIYGPYTEYDRTARGGIGRLASRLLPTGALECGKTMARALKNGEFHRGTLAYLSSGHHNSQKEILDLSDILLPNSENEMRRVVRDFKDSSSKPYAVVPNAVDSALFSAVREMPPEVSRYAGCVMCVARIEGRKNQLNLVRAMRDLPWPLLLIGKPAPNHRRYFEQILREARANVHILGEVPHERLASYYAAAKVHVLASWMETPGLSSLEAGALGCSLVVTDKGDTREYFGDDAFYCEPESVDSIRNAIIDAYEASPKPHFKQKVLSKFTWEKAAEKTLEAYRQIM